jgi:hypothetical protein
MNTHIEAAPAPPELLTIPEVCQLLKCSPRTFREFAREYAIPVCGYHRRSHRYHRDDIMDAVQRSKKVPITPTLNCKPSDIERKAASILRG